MYRKRHNRRKPMSQSQGSKRRGDLPQDSRLPKYILFPCSETRRQEKGGFYDREKQRQEASHLDIGTFYDACPAAGWGIRRGWCRGRRLSAGEYRACYRTAWRLVQGKRSKQQRRNRTSRHTCGRRTEYPNCPPPQGHLVLLLPVRGRTVKMKPQRHL